MAKKEYDVGDVEDGQTALIGPEDYLNIFSKNQNVSKEQVKENIEKLKSGHRKTIIITKATNKSRDSKQSKKSINSRKSNRPGRPKKDRNRSKNKTKKDKKNAHSKDKKKKGKRSKKALNREPKLDQATLESGKQKTHNESGGLPKKATEEELVDVNDGETRLIAPPDYVNFYTNQKSNSKLAKAQEDARPNNDDNIEQVNEKRNE